MKTVSMHIHEVVPLDPTEMEHIEKAFREVRLAKGALWIRQGAICDKVAYMTRGSMRFFHIDGEGREVTCHFARPDEFISSFSSFLTDTPTSENISAIEDTVLRVISKRELEALSIIVPKMQIFRRMIAENLFIAMEKRIAMLQSRSAQERYETLVKESPEILLRVPLQYTASFLGITPQHLSRLRKEWVKGGSMES